MPESVFEIVRKLLVEQFGVVEAEVTAETNLVKDLNADSLDCIEIIMELEGEFNFTMPDEDADMWATVADIVRYVEEKKA